MNPEVIEKLINKGRDGYEARLAAGQARLAGGDHERAIQHLQRALEFKPDQTTAWQVLGQARQAAGDAEGARHAWTTGVEVAGKRGDKQAEKVLRVWLRRLDRES